MGTIVVGVDGSPESKNALRWAVEEARLRGASVRAIHVYDDPVLRWEAYGPSTGAMFASEQFAELEESLKSRAAESQGRAKALVERAVAELLGWVSHQCAQQAVCPVVILPNLR